MSNLFREHSIGELVKKIQGGEITSDELVAASLKEIAEQDKNFHAFVVSGNPTHDTVSIEREGAMMPGIPLGVKDIYNTKDFPTQMGSLLWKGFTPGNDARTVWNVKREGMRVVGKTVTAEFAVHELNDTVNPYDATRTPGTSSSGSAVAVAVGMVPAALGTQTAGSIVRPASFCGVYAMKPSFGLIPRTGMLKTTDTLDTLGFFTIFGEDLRLLFEGMRVRGKNYPISDTALTDASRQEKQGSDWNVVFAKTHTWDGADPFVKESVLAFIEKLKVVGGFSVDEPALPSVMAESHEVHATIYDKALSYYFQNEYQRAEDVSPVMREMIEKGKTISLEEYTKALAKQVTMIDEMDAFMSDYDVLISLGTSDIAPPRGVPEKPDPSLMWTLTHLPVVHIPLFKSADGLPFGIQIVARKYNDYKLLAFLEELIGKELAPRQSMYPL